MKDITSMGTAAIDTMVLHLGRRSEKISRLAFTTRLAILFVALASVAAAWSSASSKHPFGARRQRAASSLCLSERIQVSSRPKTFVAAGKDDQAATNRPAIETKDLDILQSCALEKSPSAETVLTILRRLEESPIEIGQVGGTFELVFSSSVAGLPLLGSLLNGYMPNKEIIVFDLEAGRMSLSVETFPFVPTIEIVGNDLVWNASTSTLEYTIEGKDTSSEWTILYSDERLLVGKSSVTGYNVLRRC